ncbi:Phosphatidylinositol like protein [Argiope bruennichi]|uniref:Phosphatidylinositol like protein n=1 Tax=Argiope bruennichi TaxID=94029 RepID=A0A8T0FYW6_ARGBR|nr:Phosphatidylinositol like protein [Argiope bruennichi]
MFPHKHLSLPEDGENNFVSFLSRTLKDNCLYSKDLSEFSKHIIFDCTESSPNYYQSKLFIYLAILLSSLFGIISKCLTFFPFLPYRFYEVFLKILTSTSVGCQLHQRHLHFGKIIKEFKSKQIISLEVKNLISAVVFDLLTGWLVTFTFLHSNVPLLFFDLSLEQTNNLVSNLQKLIHWLMGVPAGLKLNIPLNSALGHFFLYHIYLWEAYMAVVLPVFTFILKSSVVIGILGVTSILCLLSDLIALATIHIYCFYGYAARLYGYQIIALSSLWRLFRGKKWNPLRERVDSYTYDIHQLFLGTLIFTVLLFLLPTVMIYYVVFTCLRIMVLAIQRIILKIIQAINVNPLYCIISMLLRSSEVAGDVYFSVLSTQGTLTFSMEVTQVSFKTVIKETLPKLDNTEEYLTWKEFLSSLLSDGIPLKEDSSFEILQLLDEEENQPVEIFKPNDENYYICDKKKGDDSSKEICEWTNNDTIPKNEYNGITSSNFSSLAVESAPDPVTIYTTDMKKNENTGCKYPIFSSDGDGMMPSYSFMNSEINSTIPLNSEPIYNPKTKFETKASLPCNILLISTGQFNCCQIEEQYVSNEFSNYENKEQTRKEPSSWISRNVQSNKTQSENIVCEDAIEDGAPEFLRRTSCNRKICQLVDNGIQFCSWLQNRKCVQRFVKKAKASFKSIANTVEVEINQILGSENPLILSIISDGSSAQAIEEAFNEIFRGRVLASVINVDLDTIPALPVGNSAGLQAAGMKINYARQNNLVLDDSVIVSTSILLNQSVSQRWQLSTVLNLDDPNLKLSLHNFTATMPVPNEYVMEAERQTSPNYHLRYYGLAVDIRQAIDAVTKMTSHDAQEFLTGVSYCKVCNHDVFTLYLTSCDESYNCHFKVLSQPVICESVPLTIPAIHLKELNDYGIHVNDDYDSPIEILIGADEAVKLITGGCKSLSCGLTAMETRLGWTLLWDKYP